MAWDEERAKQRVANHDFSDLEVNVADLSRQRDFHRLGTKDVRRVQDDLLRADEIGSLQLQAARLHCLVYRPYDDEAERAMRAVILAVSLNSCRFIKSP